MYSWIVACLFVLGWVIGPGPAFAEKHSDNEKLRKVQARIKAVQKTLEDLEVKKNSAMAHLRDSERSYGEITVALNALDKAVIEQKKQLVSIRTRRDTAKASILGQTSVLTKQIRAAHAMGRQQRVKLLLNQQDPVKLSRLLVYYDYLNGARLAQVKSFENALYVLKTSESELLQQSESLKRLRKDKEIELESLARERAVRENLLTKLDAEYTDRSTELRQLKSDEKRLQKLLRSIERAIGDTPFSVGVSKPFGKKRGKLDWPVKGKLLKRFGNRRVSGRWEGVLIGAKEGARVRAVSQGRVVYADWLRGYGLLIILDHGRGYMTLYAFNESLYKSVGDKVSTGEEIATVGRSGGRAKPGLYFEIRKKGKPVNPIRWCKKVRKGRVG